ncbi:RING-H2 finger protein ATL66-like [Salvia divinorum]|uniref:RING-H2 finger protein ATL66-like n=1 Tax=Salvia divinorum TaxID=28513 RepID=A0ABD1FUI2_SALDI
MSSPDQPFKWHYTEFDDRNFQIRGHTVFFIVVIFAVILLVALLFLYARWVCRFAPPPPPSAAVSRAQPPQPPRGLDAASIGSLPIVLHNQTESIASDGECCICLGIFGDGDKVKLLPRCQHCFHSECVDMWLVTHSSCPLCRAAIRVDSPV